MVVEQKSGAGDVYWLDKTDAIVINVIGRQFADKFHEARLDPSSLQVKRAERDKRLFIRHRLGTILLCTDYPQETGDEQPITIAEVIERVGKTIDGLYEGARENVDGRVRSSVLDKYIRDSLEGEKAAIARSKMESSELAKNIDRMPSPLPCCALDALRINPDGSWYGGLPQYIHMLPSCKNPWDARESLRKVGGKRGKYVCISKADHQEFSMPQFQPQHRAFWYKEARNLQIAIRALCEKDKIIGASSPPHNPYELHVIRAPIRAATTLDINMCIEDQLKSMLRTALGSGIPKKVEIVFNSSYVEENKSPFNIVTQPIRGKGIGVELVDNGAMQRVADQVRDMMDTCEKIILYVEKSGMNEGSITIEIYPVGQEFDQEDGE
jgi:hypothetical protein